MTSEVSPIALLDVYVAPKSLFENLAQVRKWSWIGLLLLLVLIVGSNYVFFNGMSTEWLIEQQLMHAGELSNAERDAAVEVMQRTAPYTGLLGGIFGAIAQLVMTAVIAGYFMLIAKAAVNGNHSLTYGDWFSFSIWTQMPILVSTLGFVALFMTSSTPDLPIVLANYASLNQLLLGLEPTDALFTWAESINLFLLWSMAIAAIGFSTCFKLSTWKAIGYSALPYLLIFGSWFLLV